MLSSRLKAFVIPISQTIPIGMPIQWVLTISTLVPVDSTMIAAPSWLASLTSGGSERTSSIRPATKRRVAPARIP